MTSEMYFCLLLLILYFQVQPNILVTFVTESNSVRRRDEHIFKDMSTMTILGLSMESNDSLLDHLDFQLPMEPHSKISLTVQRTDASSLMVKRRRKGVAATSKRSGSQLTPVVEKSKSRKRILAHGAVTGKASMSIDVSSKRKRIESAKRLLGSLDQRGQEKPKDSLSSSEKEETSTSIGKHLKKVYTRRPCWWTGIYPPAGKKVDPSLYSSGFDMLTFFLSLVSWIFRTRYNHP